MDNANCGPCDVVCEVGVVALEPGVVADVGVFEVELVCDVLPDGGVAWEEDEDVNDPRTDDNTDNGVVGEADVLFPDFD